MYNRNIFWSGRPFPDQTHHCSQYISVKAEEALVSEEFFDSLGCDPSMVR
jgi:hypothetical protein